MDGLDDNGDGKCIGGHLSNSSASPLLFNCTLEGDNASHRLGESAIRGDETEVPCAERQLGLLPSTTNDLEKAMKCEPSLGGIGDGLGDPLSRCAEYTALIEHLIMHS